MTWINIKDKLPDKIGWYKVRGMSGGQVIEAEALEMAYGNIQTLATQVTFKVKSL